MNHELHHLAAAYALDALDADERREFEAHYSSCDVCVSEVSDFRAVSERLAEGAATAPPADLKSRVMGQVAQTRQVSPLVPDVVVDLAERRRRKAARPLLMAAAAAVVVALVGLGTQIRTGGGASERELVIGATDAVVTSLEGDNGTIRVVWSDERDQVVVFANGLPEPGEGMIYELWFLQDEGVVPAGLFEPSGDGVVRAVLDVDDQQPLGWGVTIEPAGGSDQPTSDVLYAAQI